MEIRARYILMGLFLLAVTAGVFGFVYWLHNTAGLSDRADYRIRFEHPVSGLLTGGAVLFNGIRVGEVTSLYLNGDNPNEVDVGIAVRSDTPIRADTKVDLDFQGLTGVAVISLAGGSPDQPVSTMESGVRVLKASSSAGISMTQSARDALVRLNTILDDNSQPVKELIGNLNTFSEALARNSDKVDGIVSGLQRMTGGARGPEGDKVYNLDAAQKFDAVAQPLKGQLVVPEPSAIIELNTQAILFRPAKGESPTTGGPRWADNLSQLVQQKLVQSFENAGLQSQVSRNADAIMADYQLLVDIRNFQFVEKPEPTAQIELSLKIADSSGKILDARVVKHEVKAESTEVAAAIKAFNEALRQTLTEVVGWASGALANPA